MNVISIFDTKDLIHDLIKRAEELKKGEKGRHHLNKNLGLLFERPSTRTRVSFEVAMAQLGGNSIYLNPQDLQLGRGESIKDTALTLSRYLDAIAIRAKHKALVEFASYSTIPVINALTDLEHPCQVISDLLTIKEKKGTFDLKLAYIGDGNNVCNSLIGGSALMGMEIAVATPRGYEPEETILAKAKEISSSTINTTNNPTEAVASAEIIYTDVWVSMGQEDKQIQRNKDFKEYQVNEKLVEKADNALIMHCLPAKRGLEITSNVIDGPNSIVFDQAENRLHMQRALLETVMK
jgi:ornithine carbamoyltransferase